jgi:hypothetical protein
VTVGAASQVWGFRVCGLGFGIEMFGRGDSVARKVSFIVTGYGFWGSRRESHAGVISRRLDVGIVFQGLGFRV